MLTVYPHDLTPAGTAAALMTHGLGTLPYAIKPRRAKTVNGDDCLTLSYPYDAQGAELLLADNLIAYRGQLYRIRRVTSKESMEGRRIAVEAPHVFFDLSETYIVNIETSEDDAYPDGITRTQALTQILSGTPFSVGAVDDDGTLDYLDVLQQDRLTVIKEQLLKKWGGELSADNFTVSLLNRCGTERRHAIRRGRNIKDISCVEDVSEVVTRLHVRGYDNANFEDINGGKDYIDSAYIGAYSHIKEGYYDLDDEDDPAELLRLGRERLAQVEKPKVEYDINLAALRGTAQYRFYRDLERLETGDSVVVHHDMLSADIEARALEVTEDCLTQAVVSCKVGNTRDDLFASFAASARAAETVKSIICWSRIRWARSTGCLSLRIAGDCPRAWPRWSRIPWRPRRRISSPRKRCTSIRPAFPAHWSRAAISTTPLSATIRRAASPYCAGSLRRLALPTRRARAEKPSLPPFRATARPTSCPWARSCTRSRPPSPRPRWATICPIRPRTRS